MPKENKKETRKYNARTPIEIAMSKANKTVKDMEKAVRQITDLRNRINSLPAGDFSQMAIAFNGFLDTLPDLSGLAFVETTKPDEPDVATVESKSFLDFANKGE